MPLFSDEYRPNDMFIMQNFGAMMARSTSAAAESESRSAPAFLTSLEPLEFPSLKCKDHQGHGYVLGDASGKHQPAEWAKIAVAAYRAHHADRIVAERNNGGAMVEATIRVVDGNVPVTTVWASRGKAVRAEPVSALYEQGKVHHIGMFPKLEDQMCSFTTDFDRARAGYSPDRLDALVWGLTELLVEPMPQWGIFEYTRQCAEAIRGPTPSPPQPEYAIGCVEWHRQQQQAGGQR